MAIGYSQDPIHWSYSSKRLNDSTFEIHFTASLDDGWHVYAQKQPETAVSVPTKIEIGANPLFKLKGAIKEIGNMVLWTDPNSGIAANEYSVKVDFVQMIVMKAKIKTNISGSIQFQTCTDEMCLQPKTIKFSIPVMP
jgi:hypothetical protein